MIASQQSPSFITRNWIAVALLVFSLVLAVSSATAQFGGTPKGKTNIAASLEAETLNPKPGESVTLALDMKPAKTWHGYWENPGDAGIGLSLDWTLPKGVTPRDVRFPVPEALMISGIMNYVYEGDHAFLVDLDIDRTIAAGTKLPVKVRADWLACTDEICVPESDTLTIMLTAGDGSVTPDNRALFDGHRARLPAPLGSEAVYQSKNDIVRLSIPFPADSKIDDAYFFPLTDGVIDYSAEQKTFRDGDRIIIETAARGEAPDEITGLFKIGEHRGLALTAKKGEVAASGTPFNAAAGSGGGSSDSKGGFLTILATALGGAVLGGLLLNIMPCVFPILSLKAISLAKAGGDETAAKRDALAYSTGVILVCVLLGGLLLVLRALGEQIGWAFQLQDPRIVIALLLLVTAIAFNLAGLFEVTISAGGGDALTRQSGAKGSFWTGALAAFVATPCTAPFMAGALGAALILPPAAGLFVFAGLGLGLALPFLLLGFIPALRRRIPKPGPWMDTFRKIMSVPMFLTALALAWLLGQQTGSNGLVYGFGVAMVFAFLLWWLGARQRQGKTGNWAVLLPAIALSVAAFIWLPSGSSSSASATNLQAGNTTLPIEPYSAERLAELRAEGRPVFAYFTADWCITCKANEAAAIQREETATVFAAANVAVLEGDWTRQDAAITRYLEEHGRSGVPLYVYYAPDAEGKILPQVLTVSTLTDLVS